MANRMKQLNQYVLTMEGETRVLYHDKVFTEAQIASCIESTLSIIEWSEAERFPGDTWEDLMEHFGFVSAFEVRNLRVKWFTDQMMVKLAENESKGLWDDLDIHWLIDRLKEEVKELEDAVKLHEKVRPNNNEIIREAADVANFAMMVADVARSLEEKLWHD